MSGLSSPTSTDDHSGGSRSPSGSGSGQQRNQPSRERRIPRHRKQHLHHSSLTDIRGPRRSSRFDRVGAIHSSLTTGNHATMTTAATATVARPQILPRRANTTSDITSNRNLVRHGHNSIGFRRKSSDSFDDSSNNQDHQSCDRDDATVEDVMDLRRSNCKDSDYNDLSSSSLVSLGSLSSIDSKDSMNKSSMKFSHGIINEYGSMIRLASGTGINMLGGSHLWGGESNSQNNNDDGDENTAPLHWEKTEFQPERIINRSKGAHHQEQQQEQQQGGGELDMSKIMRLSHTLSDGGLSLLDESRKSFDAMVSLVSGGNIDRNDVSRRTSGMTGTSLMTVNLDQSKISSNMALREIGDAGNMSSFSIHSEVSSGSAWTETSPLMDEDGYGYGRMSKLYIRHCARAMAGVLVLAALSGSFVLLFFPEEERRLMLEYWLEYNLLGRVLGSAQATTTSVSERNDTAIN